MSLILPGGPGFTYCQDSLDGVTPSSTPGTSFTVGASSGEGTAVEIMELTRDCHYLVVGFTASAASTVDNSALLDVLGDPTGGTSYGSINIDNLSGWPGTSGVYFWYHLPIWIKSGTALAVRGQRNAAATLAYRCIMYAYGEPTRPDQWWCGSGMETLGANTGTSRGTPITPGNSGAWGGFTTVGTSTRTYGAIQIGLNGTDSSANTAQYHLQLGVGGSRLPGTGTVHSSNTSAELSTRLGGWQPEFTNIPNGTTIQARGTCNTTAEDFNITAHGIY